MSAPETDGAQLQTQPHSERRKKTQGHCPEKMQNRQKGLTATRCERLTIFLTRMRATCPFQTKNGEVSMQPESALSAQPFQICTSCQHVWKTRDGFLTDSEISLRGYQPHFEELKTGYFYFTHAHCGTTMLLPVRRFSDMDEGPVFDKSMRGAEGCPGYCLRWGELEECGNPCECAWVRRLMQKLRQ